MISGLVRPQLGCSVVNIGFEEAVKELLENMTVGVVEDEMEVTCPVDASSFQHPGSEWADLERLESLCWDYSRALVPQQRFSVERLCKEKSP